MEMYDTMQFQLQQTEDQDVVFKQNAACALLNLAMIDENRVSIGDCGAIPSLANKKRAVTAGVLKPLVVAAGEAAKEQGAVGVAEKAMVVLSTLAVAVVTLIQLCEGFNSVRNRGLLVGEGVISPLVALSQTRTAKVKHKSTYGLKRNWQGDPCIPRAFLWDGLGCNYSDPGAAKIISLNLSSSRLSGEIATALANLTMIQSLDLSYNNLTGDVPEFLARQDHLRILKSPAAWPASDPALLSIAVAIASFVRGLSKLDFESGS
ncbi:hypothetical protein L1987_87851 [Smallanthus sonchifolius]|nr:hypothetical protein L1987_87851 [Smallanthus sonchifolius]